MPGVGLTKPRDFTDVEKQAMAEGAAELGIDLDDMLNIWGTAAVRRLSEWRELLGWCRIAVWEYTIGGYLVLKKVAELPGVRRS